MSLIIPTVLIAEEGGTRFLGPLLPHIETLDRLLGAAPQATASLPHVDKLLAALAQAPGSFAAGE